MKFEKYKTVIVIFGVLSVLGNPPFLVFISLTLGLWLLGIPLDWSSWKTYAGIAALWFAIVLRLFQEKRKMEMGDGIQEDEI